MHSLKRPSPRWRKSSRSGNVTNCVEVAKLEQAVGVRDSKNPVEVLTFSCPEWTVFMRQFLAR
jgi:hypothetical protein